jgi:hypothetical protein
MLAKKILQIIFLGKDPDSNKNSTDPCIKTVYYFRSPKCDVNTFTSGIYYDRGNRLLGRKVQLTWSIGGIARPVEMLSRKQVATLIKKIINKNTRYLMFSERTFLSKIPEANKILKIFYEEYVIFNFTIY